MHPSQRQSALQHTLFALLLSLTAWASGLHAELAVSLSAPANNSRYSAPATIPLQADISVSGSSSVSQVAFYQGNTLIGSTGSSPYQWTWDNVAAGNYRITAQATDADGSIVSSGAINLQVGLPGTQVFYIHSDHLNTPRLVTDEQNTVVWRNLPLGEPFGLSPPEEDPDGNGVPFVLNLRYSGQYYDKETNLNYNYYRDYDPATGRYPQSDPIGLRGGINTYSYVGGNPLTRIDPDGRFWLLILSFAGGGTATAGGSAAAGGLGFWGTGALLGGGLVIASISGDSRSSSDVTSKTDEQCPPEKPCNPQQGTMCSDFHINSTPHTTRDIDGKNIGKLPDHVHIWRMNKSPKGCIWNRAEALNYTPIDAKPCSTYPSWVVQNGRQ